MRRAFALTTGLGALCFVFLSRYTTVLPWLSWWKSVRSEEDEDLEASGYLIRTPECHIPAWDPFDPSVAHLYRKVADFVCPGRPSFLRVRPNAVLMADDALLWRYYKLKHSQVKCTYREVYRTPNAPAHVADDRYNLSAPRQLTFGKPLKVHHAIVNCFHDHKEVLVQHVPLVPLSPELELKLTKLQESSENSAAVKLNVLMDVLGAVQLHGYTKIGDNTFPNIVALLTGHFLEYYWNEIHLLERLYSSGALKNTLLVFFSDHGLRFGPIRSTFVGKLEERMPIMFLAFPEAFAQQYPAAVARLRTNTRRLTTPFDVHATLQHLASFPPEHPHRTMHGLSLFHGVPFNRSCDDAFIFPHWCTCQNRTVVPVNDPGVINASHALVSAVNSQLESRAELCSPLELDKVVDATVSQPNEKVLRFVRHYHDVIGRGVQLGKRVTAPLDYMVTVMVKPSSALLEATIRYYEPTEQYVVLGDVSRLNMYGSQGECISDAVLRKFCYCRTQVNTDRGPG
ncbi:hypothetical protein HPB51_016450 [Rhipicephalus microplus]|uniref:Uncharacterized protein n=1 Tax=Rhipicephalus microplus TaxID=6941 RepID=A0A9J6DVB6_RHIMP|nr:hypothetical protein HPB51_016450 [Rhipicephalus microplus]